MRRAVAVAVLAVMWLPVKVMGLLDDWAALADDDQDGAL